MALSGTLNTTNYQGRYVQFSWTATQSIEKNESTISWTLKGAGEATSTWYMAAPFLVTIAGEEVYKSSTRIQLKNGTVVASGTKTLAHNSSGEKSFKVDVKAAIYAASYNCTGSKTFTLDNIPRAATITSANSFDDEGLTNATKPSCKWSNPLGDKATIKIGVYWDSSTALIPYETVSGTSGTKTFTLTDDQKEAIYKKLSTKDSATVYYYIMTNIDGTLYYNKVAKTVTIVNAEPTISPTVEENDERNIAATGSKLRWIKGYSDIAYNFNADVKKGATIKSYKVECGSKTATSASGVLYLIDNNEIAFTLTDSRNKTTSLTYNGYMINYTELTCSLKTAMAVYNITTEGGETESKAKATLTISGKAFGGELKEGKANSVKLEYRYKAEDGSYTNWQTVATNPTISSGKYSLEVEVSGLDYQKTYTFQARAADDLYTAYSNYKSSNEVADKALPVFDWSAEDFNFNVPVTINGLEFQKLLNALTNSYELTTTVTAGTNYSAAACSAMLVGNMVRFSMSATRNSAAEGNITNETVMTVTFDHGGKVANAYNTSFSSGGTGAASTFATTDLAKVTDKTQMTFKINLAATATASTSFSGFFFMPVTLNLNNY